MGSKAEYRDPGDLPAAVPIFPLSGALLLPRGQMPLNVFEPRYLAMVDDALRGSRIIGMIQPDLDKPGPGEAPALYQVGCIGRITQFAESGDGRYIITLTGIARFRMVEELPSMTPYRQCRIDSAEFAGDFMPRFGEEGVDRDAVVAALRGFAKANDVPVDWDSVKQAPNEALVNALAMMSPYGPREKQALLEAVDLKARADVLVAITEFELARKAGGRDTPLQ